MIGTITYFDGSGISDSRVLVLTALAGSSEAWAEFNTDIWPKALADAGVVPPWHTASAVSDKSRSGRKIPPQLIDALGFLVGHEFKAVSVGIDKAAAQQLRDRPDLQIPADAEICLNLCFKEVGIAQADVGNGDCLRLLFDRGEPFLDHLKKHWLAERKRARRLGDGWAWQTHEIEPVSALDHPGIQAADLIAWATRSTYEHGDRFADPNGFPVFIRLLLTGKHLGGFLDPQALADLFLREKHVELKHHYCLIPPGTSTGDDDSEDYYELLGRPIGRTCLLTEEDFV